MKFLRILAPLVAIAALSACGGGSGSSGLNPPGNNYGGYGYCSTGTSEQLASPQPGAYAPGTSVVTMVASGNNNNLYQSYQNWNLYLMDPYGNIIYGGPLSLVSDPNGPHPYSSDYYYNSQLQQTLPSGDNWTVYLTNNSGCQAIPLQGFST